MKINIDFIYVPKVDINEGIASGIVTKAALYFTKEYLFVLPFESLQVLLAGVETKFNKMEEFVQDLENKIPKLSTKNFEALLLTQLKPERIYKIKELEKFSIQVGFWILGGMQVRRKDGPLQSFNIQPKALRQEIKIFYNMP